MYIKQLLIAFFFLTNLLFSQPADRLFNLKIGNTEHKIGGYAGVGARYSKYDKNDAGFLDFKGALIFNNSIGIGLAGSGLYYDKKMDKLVNDGTYRINAGYTGLLVEKYFHLDERVMLNLSVISGYGTAFYRYDKDFRKEKVWSEEVIDADQFAVFEPQIELQLKLNDYSWIGINTGYRLTSPIKMIGTDDFILRSFSCGLSFKYGIF